MIKKEYIIPIFIPFLGCPHDCAFCNQVKITNYKDTMKPNKVIGEIEKNLTYFPKTDNIKEIAFFVLDVRKNNRYNLSKFNKKELTLIWFIPISWYFEK
ncbi:MAG: hypothetical protein E7G97_04690 [Haemophilus haemolyticus]|nr:hypothetical protein [Haemophilus haemolyticus]